MMRGLVLTLTLFLLLVPFVHAEEPQLVELTDSVGETTLRPGTSGLLLVGTSCGRTNFVGGTIAKTLDGVAVELHVRDITEPCPNESEGQRFDYTMAYESNGVLQRLVVQLHVFEGDIWTTAPWTLSTCRTHWLQVFEDSFLDKRGTGTIDEAGSAIRFTAPLPWEDARHAFFTSAMGPCYYGCPGRVYEAEPADRMPDPVGTVALGMA